MNNTKHTPGPWIVDSGAVYTTHSIPIAKMDREQGNGTLPVERDNNAHLIAAAPEMLDALKGLFEHCTMIHKYWGEISNVKEGNEAIDAAKSVIARAEHK